ncbi:MAG: hypothetical protein IT440_02495 [Phycisphaeraceae bacterium]|nr:hypothetical protein [Phycisphaeraceae bacterium]
MMSSPLFRCLGRVLAVLVVSAGSTVWAVDEFYDVTNAGADPADNSTDDGAAVNSAIAAGKRHLYFPPGTYNIGTTVVLPDNVILTGGGPSAIIKHKSTTQTIKLIHVSDAENVAIENLTFIGATTATSYPGATGIYIDSSITVSIRNCHFRSFGPSSGDGGCAIAGDFSSFITIRGNFFDGGADSQGATIHLKEANTHVIITGNIMDTANRYGLIINTIGTDAQEPDPGQNVVSNNIFLNADYGLICGSSSTDAPVDTVISSNVFENHAYSAMVFQGDVAGHIVISNNAVRSSAGTAIYGYAVNINSAGNILFDGNMVTETGYSSAGTARAYAANASAMGIQRADKLTISNNNIYHAGCGFGIDNASGVPMKNIEITGNIIAKVTNGFFLTGYGKEDIRITDNVLDLRDTGTIGLFIWETGTAENLNVTGNTFLGRQSAGTDYCGFFAAHAVNGKITDNRFEGWDRGISLSSTTPNGLDGRTLRIENNHFIDNKEGLYVSSSGYKLMGVNTYAGNTTNVNYSGGTLGVAVSLYPRLEVLTGSSLPSGGTWTNGDRVWFTAPVNNGGVNWMGAYYNGSTWKYMAPTQ